MNFWNDHGIMFVLGMVFIPRLMLIYLGMITPMQIPPILGMLFCPRIFMMGVLTPMYSSQNQTLIVIMWILAVILDIIGFIVKSSIGIQMQKQYLEQMSSRGF